MIITYKRYLNTLITQYTQITYNYHYRFICDNSETKLYFLASPDFVDTKAVINYLYSY